MSAAMGAIKQWHSETAETTRANKKVINIHEPLLLFLSLWRCLAVRIYWDFCLEQAMTGPHKTERRWVGGWGKRERMRKKEREREDRGK